MAVADIGITIGVTVGRRWQWVLAGVMVVVIAAVLGIWVSSGGFWSGEVPDLQEDHTTTKTKVAPLSDGGPPAGAMGMDWHVDIDSPSVETMTVQFAVGSGQVFAATNERLTAYDARTGAERWHYTEPGRGVEAFAVTGDAVVVATRDPGDADSGPRSFTGLDAISGRTLWRHGGERTHFAEVDRGSGPAGASRGVVPVLKSSKDVTSGTLAGIDARTGKTRWTYDGGDGCKPSWISGESRGDARLVVVGEHCREVNGKTRAQALDTVTGAPRWHRDWPNGDGSAGRYTVFAGVTDLNDHSGQLVNSAGHDVGRVSSGFDWEPLGVTAGHVVWDSDTTPARINTVDTKAGRTATFQLPSGLDVHPVGAATKDHMYTFAYHSAEDGRPEQLVSVDPQQSQAHYSPIPPLVPWPAEYDERPPSATWLGTGAGRLFRAGPTSDSGGSRFRLASYSVVDRTEPSELGGVPASGWPNACTLWPGHKGSPEAREKNVRIGAVTIPHTACFFEDPSHVLYFRLRDVWVARTPEQAKAFLNIDHEQAQTVDAGDEAYYSPDEDTPDQLIMRVGRYIVAFQDPRVDKKQLIPIAKDVAKKLAAQ